MTAIACDICVIGGGSAGLSVAAGAAQMGASVVLIERGAMGGECLNAGCVPSKSLIAAARTAHDGRAARRFGVHFAPPRIAFDEVHGHIQGVIAAIAPHDSVERFEGLGVRVLKEHAAFVSAAKVEAGEHRVMARRFVVATGTRPSLPPIPGLAEAGALTNESIFDLTELPEHLIVIGGGPVGLELAQSFRRLGSRVTVLERFTILPRAEPEAAGLVRCTLAGEGVGIFEQTEIAEVKRGGGGIEVITKHNAATRVVSGSHLLVAAGRVPNVESLGLDKAGIAFTPKGIAVDARLRTSNRKVFAIGDVAGGPQFTHAAAYHAGIVIRNALFGLPAKVDYAALPAVTFTDPEVAQAGLTEIEARGQGEGVTIISQPFTGNDRAQAERLTEGFAKIVLGRRGRILGATIVGAHAGELIGLWGLAIARKLPLSAIAGMIAPYPTFGEISKRAAGSYYAPRLFGAGTRRLVRFIQTWLP